MNDQDDPRIERLKEVLSSSYPRVMEKENLQPLPQSILDRLHPKEEVKEPSLTRVISFFARPLPALAAVAVVTLCAVLVFESAPPLPDQNSGIRSGNDTSTTPQLILLNPPPSALENFKQSAYFPEDLLSSPSSFIPAASPAIVVDWEKRTITRHLPNREAIVEALVDDESQVLEQVLEIYQEALSE
ncbi:hypothetical protein N9891_01950 [bacterium]|nr:hypothetical protein [bacterium]